MIAQVIDAALFEPVREPFRGEQWASLKDPRHGAPHSFPARTMPTGH